MILGSVEDSSSIEEQFIFTSDSNQIINITLVPEKSLDDFDIGIYDASGKLIGTSESATLIDNITIKARSGEQFTVLVKLAASY